MKYDILNHLGIFNLEKKLFKVKWYINLPEKNGMEDLQKLLTLTTKKIVIYNKPEKKSFLPGMGIHIQ